MKALSLWQPWASLMALGLKRVETRSWRTKYRGDIAICSAKKREHDGRALWSNLLAEGVVPRLEFDDLPFGRLLCVVRLVDCPSTLWLNTSTSESSMAVRDEYFPGMTLAAEVRYGNYAAGRFAWLTTDLRATKQVAVTGHQGLFDLDDGLVAAALL